MASLVEKGTVVGGLVALGTLLGVILKSVLPYRKSVIDSLSDRIEKLEADLAAERATYTAEIALLRHRVANAEHALDMFIELIDAQPEKARDHAAKVKARREQDRELHAAESAVIRAAAIQAAGGKAVQ